MLCVPRLDGVGVDDADTYKRHFKRAGLGIHIVRIRLNIWFGKLFGVIHVANG